MNTQEVANRLIQLCREGKNLQAIDELYDENITSKEPKGTPMEFTEGKDAVKGKTVEWENMVEELHSASISEAQVAEDFFTVVMDMDVTYKGMGRMAMKEIAVYEVKDGKIVAEEFFYKIPVMAN
ncbi:nuclear transport factor 2 family protein [Pedobacter foliorum]|uniref:nuclear transport factor 2 family protein n=1 Tax=Pedobacter foliorum TaxID=2739058 RepID=UPI00156539B7|nr:nuclear transport factor 2 family protein [Pedobacter foliorum]NRF38305.1 nuclear transport factor 2 family protein [Pedobacter foliorum]